MLVSNFMEGFFITIRSNSIILLLIQSCIFPCSFTFVKLSLAFEYQGTRDVDLLSAEPIDREDGLRVIHIMFPDQLSVPYVPTVFRASKPPSKVRFLSCPTAFCRVDCF